MVKTSEYVSLGRYKLMASTNKKSNLEGKEFDLYVDEDNHICVVDDNGDCIWQTSRIKSSKKVCGIYSFQTQNSIYKFEEVKPLAKFEEHKQKWNSVMDAIREFDRSMKESSIRARAILKRDYEEACKKLDIQM